MLTFTLASVLPLTAAFGTVNVPLRHGVAPVVRTTASSIQMINLFGNNGLTPAPHAQRASAAPPHPTNAA